PSRPPHFPYTTLFRSGRRHRRGDLVLTRPRLHPILESAALERLVLLRPPAGGRDRLHQPAAGRELPGHGEQHTRRLRDLQQGGRSEEHTSELQSLAYL